MISSLLVTTYVNPDLDGVAGAIAYGEFLAQSGRSSTVAFVGELHGEANFVLTNFSLQQPLIVNNTNNFDQVILVDSSDLAALEGYIDPAKVIEIIDHRSVHEADKFVNAKSQIELVGAAATLVAERFMNSSITPSSASAILLYSAIISNTLNFKGSVTTERDRLAATYLNNIAELPSDYWRQLFTAKSDLSGSKLEATLVGDSSTFVIGQNKLSIAQIEVMHTDKLITDRLGEIIAYLNSQKLASSLDFIFLNLLDLETGANYLVAPNLNTQSLLRSILGVDFIDSVALNSPSLLRKQIMPLIRTKLELNG